MYATVEILTLLCPNCQKADLVEITWDEYQEYFVFGWKAEKAFSTRSSQFIKYITEGYHFDCQEILRNER